MYEVLIGAGATLLGVIVGALLEWWRDDTRWKREEQMRWTSDLRVLYRDLLSSGDEFFRRLEHTRMLERRIKRERGMSEEESHRILRLLNDSFDVMERESQRVRDIAAEVELIGSKEESEAVAGSESKSSSERCFRQTTTWDTCWLSTRRRGGKSSR